MPLSQKRRYLIRAVVLCGIKSVSNSFGPHTQVCQEYLSVYPSLSPRAQQLYLVVGQIPLVDFLVSPDRPTDDDRARIWEYILDVFGLPGSASKPPAMTSLTRVRDIQASFEELAAGNDAVVWPTTEVTC